MRRARKCKRAPAAELAAGRFEAARANPAALQSARKPTRCASLLQEGFYRIPVGLGQAGGKQYLPAMLTRRKAGSPGRPASLPDLLELLNEGL